MTSLAAVSSIAVPRKTIRSSISFEYGSTVRVPVDVRSVKSGRTWRAAGRFMAYLSSGGGRFAASVKNVQDVQTVMMGAWPTRFR